MAIMKVQQQELSVLWIVMEETSFTTPSNARLMVTGSNDMVVESVFVNLVATQRGIVVKMILVTRRIQITIHFVCHALTNVNRTPAIKKIFLLFTEMEAGDALGLRMIKARKNTHVSLCAVKTKPNKSCLAEPMTMVSVSGEVMLTVFANVKNNVTWLI